MPKQDIDYSNTIIYKIICKNPAVTDVYVGHTTNFVQRKQSHKYNCNTSNHTCKLYEIIKANGGWHNWSMVIINFYNCINLSEAKEKEQEYFVSLNATLNSVEPSPGPKPKVLKSNTSKQTQIFYCSTCKINTCNSKVLEQHIITNEHITNVNKQNTLTLSNSNTDSVEHVIVEKTLMKFICEKCNIDCYRKNDWDRHILTKKHIGKKLCEQLNFICKICNKIYKSRKGLWFHNKTCISNEEHLIDTESKNSFNDILLKERAEFKDILIDIVKNNNEIHTQMLSICKSLSVI